MRVNREQLLNDLDMVKGGLSPREFIEQSSCFVFQGGQVMTFNDEVACRKEVGLGSIQGAVQAGSLLDILQKVDDEELDVTQESEGEFRFKGKRKSFGLVADKEIFLPIDRVEMPGKWHPLAKEFTEAVGLVQHCVSTDESKFILTCVHIHPDYIEACDNRQIMRCRLKTGATSSVLVRGTSIAHIVQLGMDQLSMTKSWLHFKNQQGLVFSVRRHTEDFPSLDSLLKFKGHPVVMPKGVAAASDRASVFASDKTGEALISVELKKGKMRVVGEGATGWYAEGKEVTYEGPDISFLIAPSLLQHVSEKYDEATISDTRLKVAGGHWEYITVLGRPDQPEEEGDGKDES